MSKKYEQDAQAPPGEWGMATQEMENYFDVSIKKK